MHLTSWGKYPVVDTVVACPRSREQALVLLEKATSCIGRGLGRSYGDSALNGTGVFSCLRLDHMESFDPECGVLVAEAGVSLKDIVEAFLPRGWFLPVTPGTKFVTLGGAVASDVHGKDHHVAGTFSQHVRWLDLWTPTRGVLRCSPEENADIFRATAGGMGLTGIILRVAVQLVRVPSAWIAQDMIKANNLVEIMDIFENSGSYPFSVAWIDCLQTGAGQGRSILMAGHFAQPDELPEKAHRSPHTVPRPRELGVPMDFPSCTLNRWSVRAFNALYYGKAPRGKSRGIVSYNSFFYPLDAIHNWNRIYGRRGFTQYQFVIPREGAQAGLSRILSTIAASGQGSFLAVLKLFGEQPSYSGNISFPTKGYTLALDFAITDRLFPLLDTLDALVLEYGGRHYLTKDCRLPAAVVQRGYGAALDAFREMRDQLDPQHVLTSLQSQRLGL